MRRRMTTKRREQMNAAFDKQIETMRQAERYKQEKDLEKADLAERTNDLVECYGVEAVKSEIAKH